jgi:hypothetical protein
MANILDILNDAAAEVADLEIQRKKDPGAFAGRRVKGRGYVGTANEVAKTARGRLVTLASRLDKVIVS